jgi:hypothetical protein
MGIACSAEAGGQATISASIITRGIMAETRSIDFLLPIDKNFITLTMSYQKIVELKIVYMRIRKLILTVSENQKGLLVFLSWRQTPQPRNQALLASVQMSPMCYPLQYQLFFVVPIVTTICNDDKISSGRIQSGRNDPQKDRGAAQALPGIR